MAINNKDRTFDLASGTDLVSVWNPLLKLVRGSILCIIIIILINIS